MTLHIEDLEQKRALEIEETRAVSGGLGPIGLPVSGSQLGQLSGQTGQNSIVGSAASYGVLNTTLNLQLQVAPQISVQAGSLVDLDSIVDTDQVVNSVLA